MHVRFAGQTVNEILEKIYRNCTTSQITLNVIPHCDRKMCWQFGYSWQSHAVQTCEENGNHGMMHLLSSQVLQASLLKSAIWTSVEEYHVLKYDLQLSLAVIKLQVGLWQGSPRTHTSSCTGCHIVLRNLAAYHVSMWNIKLSQDIISNVISCVTATSRLFVHTILILIRTRGAESQLVF